MIREAQYVQVNAVDFGVGESYIHPIRLIHYECGIGEQRSSGRAFMREGGSVSHDTTPYLSEWIGKA